MMRYLPLLLLLTLSLNACKGHLPPKPEVDLCMVSFPTPVPSDGPDQFRGCKCAKADGSGVYNLTFAECDKYIAVELERFQALGNYIIELERIASKQCRGGKGGFGALETIQGMNLQTMDLIGQ